MVTCSSLVAEVVAAAHRWPLLPTIALRYFFRSFFFLPLLFGKSQGKKFTLMPSILSGKNPNEGVIDGKRGKKERPSLLLVSAKFGRFWPFRPE